MNTQRFILRLLSVSTSVAVSVFVLMTSARAQADTLSSWASQEATFSVSAMYRNISPAGTASGSVIASPSNTHPNYYYYWVRDAALTMDEVVTLYVTSQNSQQKSTFLNTLTQYVEFSRRNQLTPNLSGPADGLGLGEPKFNVDGSAFMGAWGRPQNDGPALRAVTLIRLANQLMNEGQASWVRSNLYDGFEPSSTVIKVDLDFVAHHWQDRSVDLWEEVTGDHFFTRMAQRRALIEGAALANALGDPNAANFYLQQSQALSQSLAQFWSDQAGYVGASLNTNGAKDKYSNLDVAVVLGSLHGYANDNFYSPGSDSILGTAERIRQAFANGLDEGSPNGGNQSYPAYGINGTTRDFENGVLGTAIGRYPEDNYDGYEANNEGSNTGNPWFLATEAYAELCYRAATEWSTAQRIPITALNLSFLTGIGASNGLRVGDVLTPQDSRFRGVLGGLVAGGDSYLRRVRFHMDGTGSLSEEMNRDSGYMQGANDLTWSYAALLTAVGTRPSALATQ
jgi:glucoamylase